MCCQDHFPPATRWRELETNMATLVILDIYRGYLTAFVLIDTHRTSCYHSVPVSSIHISRPSVLHVLTLSSNLVYVSVTDKN